MKILVVDDEKLLVKGIKFLSLIHISVPPSLYRQTPACCPGILKTASAAAYQRIYPGSGV